MVGNEINRIYLALTAAPTLAPGPQVNYWFSRLVQLVCIEDPVIARSVLNDSQIRAIKEELRRICSIGETLLETHWARRLVQARSEVWDVLNTFPYFENYRQLCRLEMNAVSSVAMKPPKRVLLVGSGPLPLTAIILAQEYSLAVTCADVAKDAYELGLRVANRLNLSTLLEFAHADICQIDDLASYDLILLASLVGPTKRDKARVLKHLGCCAKPGTLLVARSAARLRTLLYPKIEIGQLGSFEPLLEIHPYYNVINSVIVAKQAD